ncbi:hypothetical protein [uncultured Campylobacter sp.]|uniref:hypothetical protein n=1 Tax=uncultured Campylobacter sp. TaxID=218934 RepID=UPI00260195A1|nr:hypothetical protein [uncultured Campylobacter sp.]
MGLAAEFSYEISKFSSCNARRKFKIYRLALFKFRLGASKFQNLSCASAPPYCRAVAQIKIKCACVPLSDKINEGSRVAQA